jgi:hypothetical protein
VLLRLELLVQAVATAQENSADLLSTFLEFQVQAVAEWDALVQQL